MPDLGNNTAGMSAKECCCSSGKPFIDCCEPLILGKQAAPTAEALMRSRYTAYATQQAGYLIATTAAVTRKFHNKTDILDWAESNKWVRLEILSSSESIVEFKAYYIDSALQMQVHHEISKFVKVEGKWFYLDHA